MLSCLVNNVYVEAHKNLNKNLDFRCPLCNQPVALKAGAKKIAHFSHKSNLECEHGAGETLWHRKGKHWVANYFRNKKHFVEFEVSLGNRRTDVLIITSKGKKKAVEFQKKDEGAVIYKRTNDLLRYVDKVVWVLPWQAKLVDNSYRATATYAINALYSDKNPVKADVMFYDDKNDELLLCSKHDWTSYVEQTDFGGGYDKKSRRWCKLVVLQTFRNMHNQNLKERLPPLLSSFLVLQFISTEKERDLRLAIDCQRMEFTDFLEESPSLEHHIDGIIGSAYKLAILQTLQQHLELDETIFPESCPWTLAQISDNDYYPNAGE